MTLTQPQAQATSTRGLIPASAAWRPGDPVAGRSFVHIGDVPLEGGGTLPDVTLAYETWGELNAARDNAVYVAHAFTGDAHAAGEAGPGQPTPGWWNSLIGPGRPLDPSCHFIVCANVIGGCQGSTGPASAHPEDGKAWGSRFPWVSIRDMVQAEVQFTDLLGIDEWRLVIGPSMGGMRAVEWAATHPERVRGIVGMGTTAATTAEQIAWNTSQAAAVVADPGFRGGDYYDAVPGEGPHVGLGIARQIAHITYRSERELDVRFGRDAQGAGPAFGPEGQFTVQSYLAHHGDKLARRFDANTYLRMIHAVNSHDVGRGRGGVDAALAVFDKPALVVAVDSDRLYPLKNAQALSAALPGSHGVKVVHSEVGHDGFLVESEQFNAFVGEFERGL